MGQKFYNENNIAAIADAIRAKNGLTQTYRVIDMPDAIAAIPAGGGPTVDPDADVRFFDYDGKLLYTYTAAEFQALTEMPENPSHTGLTAQGWNWSLADAKAQVTAMGQCDIGQMYITSSGDTEIDIVLSAGTLNPICGICVDGEVTIDWGDNTTIETKTGTSLTSWLTIPHTYAHAGEYTITIHVVSGSFAISGATSTNNFYTRLLWTGFTNTNFNAAYNSTIKNIRLGNNVSFTNGAFSGCYNLEKINLPANSVLMEKLFNFCYTLKCIIIPSSNQTTLASSIIHETRNLEIISIPKNFTSFYSALVNSYLKRIVIPYTASLITGAFNNCYSLLKIKLPNSASINGGYTFGSCRCLKQIVFPNSTSTGTYCCSGNTSLMNVKLPDNLNLIETSCFLNCYSLAKIEIPATVTRIYGSAFSGCVSLKQLILKPTTPPILENINAFNNVPSDCIFYVPNGKLTDYQTANNWSTFSSYMQEMPA